MGRVQPKGCYLIQIAFWILDLQQGVNPRVYQLGSALNLSFSTWLRWLSVFQKEESKRKRQNNSIRVAHLISTAISDC